MTNPISIEGKIVCIADEIAQCCSDFSDSMISKTFMFDEFISILPNRLKRKNISYNDAETLIREYLISGLTYSKADESIFFNKKADDLLKTLKKFARDQIQHSYLIRSTDSKNCHMIRQVFKAFYHNPRQLDDATLVNAYSDIYRSHIPSIKRECTDTNGSIDSFKVCEFLKETCKRVESISHTKDDETIFILFLTNIAYYIADMTDAFLIKKYHKLYNGKED